MSNKLPYDSRIEYLESTGTQWIDTNLSPNGNNSVEINANIIRINSLRGIICGNFQDNTDKMIFSFEIGGTTNNYAGRVRSYRKINNNSANDIWDSSVIPLNTKCDVTYKYVSSSSKLYIINNTYGTSINTASSVGSSTTTHSLRLFLDYRNPNTAIANPIRICSMTIKINDSLVMDLIPVRKGNVGYMYDKVSGQLFGNAGTGEFILGQDIVEVEYLESTGTQYIDLGRVLDSSNDVIDLEVMATQRKDVTLGVFGARKDANNKNFSILISSSNNSAANVYMIYINNGTYTTYRVEATSMAINKIVKLHLEKSLKEIYIDNILDVSSSLVSPNFSTETTATIFNINGSTFEKVSARLYSLKWKQGTTLIMDLIPVRVGQVGYMYDKISSKLFGNNGTGNFILGRDMKLPYDADIKYLECNGTQYINTLIVPNQNTRIECKYAFKEYNDTQIVFGCTDSADATDAKNGIVNLHLSAGTRRVGFGNGSGTVYASNTLSQPNTEYTIYFNKNEVYVNNTLITTLPTSSWSTTKELFLFRRNGGTAYPLRGYIMYCKIWDDTTLVRDFTPVRVGQVGYMYDKVSRQLFGNSGTGSFVIPGTRFAKLILNNGAAVEINGSGALSQSMVSGYMTNCVGLVCGTLCTSIEANTFENFTNLASAELEDSNITTIKNYGFSGCSKLYKVTLPNTITSIGQRSFRYCTSLTTFNIPSSLKTIDYWAFDGCTSLESIVIPSTVTTVGAYAFQGCSNLTTLELYSMVTSGKNISEGMCISCTKLSSIVLPYGILGIGAHSSFKNCYALESVSIPNTVSAIGRESFRNCRSLTSVTIPSSVTSIGNLVFENCTSLTSVTCLATTPPTLGTNSFDGNASGRKIYVPSESVETYKTATNWSAYANDILPIPTE